jgi:phosphomannomutase
MLSKIFKAYDVRGIYPDPLAEVDAFQVGFGTATHLMDVAAREGRTGDRARTLVVGRDMRKSSPSLVRALKDGMIEAGAVVVDVGMVDTPFTYFAANHLDAAGAVQTTASHNPAQYNGFKVSGIGARPVGQDTGLSAIKSIAEGARRGSGPGGGREESRDLWDAYRAHLLRFLPASVLDGSRTLHVVIDASNGMAGTMVPKVFGDVKGLRITPINFDNSTGEFVHEPNPLVEANLAPTREGVRALKADFGVCFDGDADRCMVIDERGEPVGCDLLTGWLAQGWLEGRAGASIVYDLRSTRSVAEAVRERGGVPVEGRVGHVFMKQRLRETGAPRRRAERPLLLRGHVVHRQRRARLRQRGVGAGGRRDADVRVHPAVPSLLPERRDQLRERRQAGCAGRAAGQVPAREVPHARRPEHGLRRLVGEHPHVEHGAAAAAQLGGPRRGDGGRARARSRADSRPPRGPLKMVPFLPDQFANWSGRNGTIFTRPGCA